MSETTETELKTARKVAWKAMWAFLRAAWAADGAERREVWSVAVARVAAMVAVWAEERAARFEACATNRARDADRAWDAWNAAITAYERAKK